MPELDVISNSFVVVLYTVGIGAKASMPGCTWVGLVVEREDCVVDAAVVCWDWIMRDVCERRSKSRVRTEREAC